MKYQIGDRVMLMHSGEEGNLVEFINNKMVVVDVDGVTFPVFLDQIDFPYFKKFSEKKTDPGLKSPPKQRIEDIRTEKPSAKYAVAEGIWLSFLPVFDKDVFDEDIVEYFRLSLVNQTADPIRFEYEFTRGGESSFSLRNEILPFGDIYLHDVPIEEMNDTPRFVFVLMLKDQDPKRATHFEYTLKVRAKQLFQRIEEMRSQQKAHFTYLLLDQWPARVVEKQKNGLDVDLLKKAGFQVRSDKSRPDQFHPPPQSVVDLHIEKITDEWKRMSSFEILDAQLGTFSRHLDSSIAHHQPKLTVIHGNGSGKLRDEIHQLLRSRSEVKSFVNQFHPLFGYGATEIYLQY
jgi:hypothetical protein